VLHVAYLAGTPRVVAGGCGRVRHPAAQHVPVVALP
jgi:hypothetical protein